jgi:hypothetical protein
LLLDHGAEVHATDDNGKTALARAETHGATFTAALLKRLGVALACRKAEALAFAATLGLEADDVDPVHDRCYCTLQRTRLPVCVSRTQPASCDAFIVLAPAGAACRDRAYALGSSGVHATMHSCVTTVPVQRQWIAHMCVCTSAHSTLVCPCQACACVCTWMVSCQPLAGRCSMPQ